MASNLNKGVAFKSLSLGSLVLTNAQYDELYDIVQAKVASVGATADKGIEVGGTATAPTIGIKLDPTAGNLATLSSNGLMVTAPAQANWYIKKLASGDEGYDASLGAQYALASGAGTSAIIDIPKDMVVSGGEVKTVATADQPYAGAKVGDKYIELTVANADSDKLYIPVKDLVDLYTGGTGADGMVTVTVGADNTIKAVLNDGTITYAKLDTSAGGLKEKVDAGVAAKSSVDAILDGTTIDSFADVEAALADKQDTLTFDTTPTSNSTNPVQSGGVYTALQGKANKLGTLTDATTVSDIITGLGGTISNS